jgi:tRNA threonylcarbamoyl adenosine modification protein YeaZ
MHRPAMRMLAIECATEVCSLALFEGEDLLDSRHEILGRGHAEHLVPLIASLPDKGRAAEIRVSLGPGSFTGVRIGLAAARALGLAWRARVRGYPTLALVAQRSPQPGSRSVTVCMAGGHGQWFVQNFDEGHMPEDEARSLPPEEALRGARHSAVAGNRARELAGLDADRRIAIEVLPDARYAARLPESLLTDDLSPIYGRGPDARLPA